MLRRAEWVTRETCLGVPALFHSIEINLIPVTLQGATGKELRKMLKKLLLSMAYIAGKTADFLGLGNDQIRHVGAR